MTIIVAGALADCAFLIADRKRADLVSGNDAGTVRKVIQINDQVVAAKAGYGPSADDLWQPVLHHPEREALKVDDVAAILEETGGAVYQRCLPLSIERGVVDPGLHVLIAGAGKSSSYRIHAINFGNWQTIGHSGPMVFAFGGMRADTSDRVQDLFRNIREDTGSRQFIQLDRFSRTVMEAGMQWAPQFVGYPCDLATVISERGTRMAVIGQSGGCDPALRRRVT